MTSIWLAINADYKIKIIDYQNIIDVQLYQDTTLGLYRERSFIDWSCLK